MTLLVAAAKNFVPVNHEMPCLYEDLKTIPQPSERPSIDQIISEIESSNWYVNQIVDRRTIEAKEAQTGIVNFTKILTTNHDTSNFASRIFTSSYVANDIERCSTFT
jgi:hypothetical protein